MGLESSDMIISALFTHYMHYILPYECKKDKDGIDVKIETEYLRGIKKKYYDDANSDQSASSRNTYSPSGNQVSNKSNKEVLNDKELTDTVVDLADFVNSDDFDFNFDLPEYILSNERETSNVIETTSISDTSNALPQKDLKSPDYKPVSSSMSPAVRQTHTSSTPSPQNCSSTSANGTISWNGKTNVRNQLGILYPLSAVAGCKL